MTKSPHHDESAPMSDPNTGGNRKCCHVCRTEDGVGCKGLWYGVENRQCPCHRTTSTLEQIQKERRRIFLALWDTADLSLSKERLGEIFASNSDESIRIAYEAGYKNCWHAFEDTDSYQIGFRAGLERAKVLVPVQIHTLEEVAEINRNIGTPLSEHAYHESKGWIECRTDILSALDTEIAKNTPPQLSERDADWGGLPDENARATSDL